jgi:uncharacterized protein (DUF1697 family)
VPVCVALLRAINVAGHAPIPMARLREWLTALGYEDVRSYLQTGNLVFSDPHRPRRDLEEHLEAEADRRLHLRTDFLVRTATQWTTILENNPFPAMAEDDPAHLVVVMLKKAPPEARVRDLATRHSGPEELRVGARHLYVTYPAGIGTSRLTLARIEATLAIRGTARNWNTVRALAALAR